jgi:hypothetical protein
MPNRTSDHRVINIHDARLPERRVNTRTRQEYEQLIAAAWQKAVDSILETGRLLMQAKDELRGEFFKMFSNEGPLPFGQRTAQMLMAVAANPVLANPNHGSLLPPCWRTLYELSRLPVRELEQMLASGQIRPDLERHDVDLMVKEFRAEGIYLDNLPRYLLALIDFMEQWPQAATLVPRVLKQQAQRRDEDRAISAEALNKLAPWLASLAAAYDQERRKRMKDDRRAPQARPRRPAYDPRRSRDALKAELAAQIKVDRHHRARVDFGRVNIDVTDRGDNEIHVYQPSANGGIDDRNEWVGDIVPVGEYLRGRPEQAARFHAVPPDHWFVERRIITGNFTFASIEAAVRFIEAGLIDPAAGEQRQWLVSPTRQSSSPVSDDDVE